MAYHHGNGSKYHNISTPRNAPTAWDTQNNTQYRTPDANMASLIYYGMTVPMREVVRRALSLNARPLPALLATSTCTPRAHAPLKHVAAFDSSPHSPATVLIAHLHKRTPEHM